MERSNFIKLLEEYKNRAIMELHKEARVQASLLLTDEFRAAVVELESSCRVVNTGLGRVACELDSISKDNQLSRNRRGFYYCTATESILTTVISTLTERIHETEPYRLKESEIRTKFDAAINTAKMSRSAVRLKELADALGIETPAIEVTNKVASTVDTEFVKEKIKSVLKLV